MLYLTKALSCSMDMDNRDFTLLTMHGSCCLLYTSKVTVTEDGTVSYALIPVYASDGQTKQMDANAAPGLFSYMESISDNASVDAAGIISEK